MGWYVVVKKIKGIAYRYRQRTWRENGRVHDVRTPEPGLEVAKIVARVGEPESLEIIRPSLEDIYLRLVAEHSTLGNADLLEDAS